MSKSSRIGIIVGVILIIVAGGYILYTFTQKNSVEDKTVQTTLNPVNGGTVGEKLPETNPFNTKVNPYDAYKNPFGN